MWIKIFNDRKEHIFILFISLLALIPRYMFRDFQCGDMRGALLPWYEKLSSMNPKIALSTQVGNYNLLYQLVIYLLSFIKGEAIYKIKIFSVIFDYVLAAGVYAFVKKISEKKAFVAYAITLFLPTVWLNSALWGQCDAIYVSLIIVALYMLYTGRPVLSFILLGVAFAFKLQTVFIIPFYVFAYIICIKNKKRDIRLWHFALIPLTVVATALPNIIAGRPVKDIFDIYLEQTDTYKYITMNYPSFWNVIHLVYENDKAWCIGITCLALIFLMIFIFIKKADVMGKHFLWCAFLISYTCVLFLPSMHERYGMLYEILALIMAFGAGYMWITVFMFQLISMKTYFYYLYGSPLNLEFLSFINVAIYVMMLIAFWRELSGCPYRLTLFERETRMIKDKAFKISKNDLRAMVVLTAVFLLIGCMHLGSMKAPESSVMVGTETNVGREIRVSLPQKEYVESICIYPLMSEKSYFALFYAVDGEWVQYDGETTLGFMFTWKKIDVKAETYQFCLIFTDPEVEIGEIVCLDNKGKQIELSIDGYPTELFDEQDTLLTYPTGFDSMIFDEIYHGRTGYEFVHGLDIYENTHPPLGKIIIAAGIKLFGMNPFGYRIMTLLFGALCIPVMYLMALRITGETRYAMLAGVLEVTEFMHYTLSRISTIDIFVAFFVISMFYFIIAFLQEEKNKYLVFSGISFAFGVATKWTAIYGAAGVALILFVWMIVKIRRCVIDKNSGSFNIPAFITICISVFIILPAFVYVISFIPFAIKYPDKSILTHAIDSSIGMYNYHKDLDATHPFQSPWYSWLFDWIPLIDARNNIGDYKSTIATFVNPFVCFVGLASVIHHFYLSYTEIKGNIRYDKEGIGAPCYISTILLVFYLCMLAPWFFVTRIVFIYQYFICTMILILMICNSIRNLTFKREDKVIRTAGIVSALLFAVYLPVISGIQANAKYIDEILRILPKWWF